MSTEISRLKQRSKAAVFANAVAVQAKIAFFEEKISVHRARLAADEKHLAKLHEEAKHMQALMSKAIATEEEDFPPGTVVANADDVVSALLTTTNTVVSAQLVAQMPQLKVTNLITIPSGPQMPDKDAEGGEDAQSPPKRVRVA